MRLNISLLFISVLFTTCSPKKDKLEVIRDWKVIRYLYSNATLSLYENHEFTYYETGHLSKSYSQGIWRVSNDTLILNSFTKECLFIDDFSLSQADTIDELQTTIKDCEPNPNSSFFTEFKNSKFTFTKDSLNYLNLNPDYLKKYGNYKIF